MTHAPETAITWLGHATIEIETPAGAHILIDPWLGNPRSPRRVDEVTQLDAILLTHGHTDHVADAAELAKAHDVPVVGIAEVCGWLAGQGVENCIGMNKGGTVEVAGIAATMTVAFHSSSMPDGSYGGEPSGFVLTIPDGPRVYVAGDTCVFGDMRLIAELYEPELVVLPIGDHYTMGPREAAHAVRLLQCTQVLPVHYGTFPLLTGTPDALRSEAADVEGLVVHEPEPGGTVRIAAPRRTAA